MDSGEEVSFQGQMETHQEGRKTRGKIVKGQKHNENGLEIPSCQIGLSDECKGENGLMAWDFPFGILFFELFLYIAFPPSWGRGEKSKFQLQIIDSGEEISKYMWADNFPKIQDKQIVKYQNFKENNLGDP